MVCSALPMPKHASPTILQSTVVLLHSHTVPTMMFACSPCRFKAFPDDEFLSGRAQVERTQVAVSSASEIFLVDACLPMLTSEPQFVRICGQSDARKMARLTGCKPLTTWKLRSSGYELSS